MKKSLLILLLALSAAVSARAGGEVSGVALPFLCVNQDPASAAMGDLSLRTHAAYTVWMEERADLGFAWQKWTPDASSFLSLAGQGRIGERFGVRARFVKQNETPYDLFDDNAQAAGSFTPGALLAGAGLSVKITDQFSAGVDAYYASRTLAQDSKTGAFAADIALMGRFGAVSVAGGLQALGSKVQAASGARFSLPSSLFITSGYDARFGEKNGLLAALEARYYFYGAPAVNIGLEYNWSKILFVRAGYHYGGIIPSHASAGAGFCIKGFHLHFTYLAGSDPIGGSMLIGAGYRF